MLNRLILKPCTTSVVGNVNDHEVCYRMTSHLFGGVWCDSSSIYALGRTVGDSHSVHPLIPHTVEKAFYVDDCLKSVSLVSDALLIVTELPKVLQTGWFHLTKCVVNHEVLLNTIAED